jgi:HEAT repeat protein
MTRVRPHLSAVLTVSLVALTLSPFGWAAPQQPEQGTTLPALQQAGQDIANPSAQVRRKALRALREHGGPETLPLYARLVGDFETDIREGAILGVIVTYVHPPMQRSVGNAAAAFEAARLHDQPWSVPPELSTALVRALADNEPAVRRDAAYAVGIVLAAPVTNAVAFELVASLSDPEPPVRVAAARAIGRLQVENASVPLVGGINDEDLDVRLASMRALGELRSGQAVAALTDQFRYYERGVAGRSAMSALAAIAHRSTVPLFEEQTASRNAAHRQAAYEGLARSGVGANAATRIEAAMASEKDAGVRLAMAFALASAGRDGINSLLDALSDRDRSDDALKYLVELGLPHVDAVAARISETTPLVRGQIATALGFIGGPKALEALKRASGEPDPDVRQRISVAQFRLERARTAAKEAP